MQITENLLQAIANYLVTRPYQEVVGLLSELQKELNVIPKQEEPTTGEGKQEEVLPPKSKKDGGDKA